MKVFDQKEDFCSTTGHLLLPELILCDYFMFPKTKIQLYGPHLELENMQQLITNQLKTVTVRDFQRTVSWSGNILATF